MQGLAAKLAVAIGLELPVESYLDGTAQGNSIPTSAEAYLNRSFHGYFIAPTVPAVTWDAERVTFSRVTPVEPQTGPKENAGAHTLAIRSGRFVNRSGHVFTLSGGVIEDSLLHFTANKDVPATRAALTRKRRPIKREDVRPISVQCIFPYSLMQEREGKTFRVFIGFWVGKLRGEERAGQVMVNGFVLSEEPLSLDELNGLYRTCPIQLCLTVGQAVWGGSGPFDTRPLEE